MKLLMLNELCLARSSSVSISAVLSSVVGSTAGEDCTAAGYADYYAAPVSAANDIRKNGVNVIGAPALVGSAARLTAGTATPTNVTYTGTDGNPTASWAVGSSGFWSITAFGTDKVSVTIPLPDTNSHTIKVACGVWNNVNTATVTARGSLSGGGAGPTADVITEASFTQTYSQITYTVRANSGGQNFVFTIEGTSSASVASDVWLLLNRITYL